MFGKDDGHVTSNKILVYFQNERIFVQLDELDELDKIINASIYISQKTL